VKCVRRVCLSEMKDLYWDIIKDFSIGIKQLDTKEVLSAQIKGSYLNDSTYDKLYPNVYNCYKRCPTECMQYDYLIQNEQYNTNETTNATIEVGFNNQKLLVAYVSSPIINFIDLIYEFGGLNGIWFGTSALDVYLLVNVLKPHFSRDNV